MKWDKLGKERQNAKYETDFTVWQKICGKVDYFDRFDKMRQSRKNTKWDKHEICLRQISRNGTEFLVRQILWDEVDSREND